VALGILNTTVTRVSTARGQCDTPDATTPDTTAASTVHSISVARNSEDVVERGLPLPLIAEGDDTLTVRVAEPSSRDVAPRASADGGGGGGGGGVGGAVWTTTAVEGLVANDELLDGVSTCSVTHTVKHNVRTR